MALAEPVAGGTYEVDVELSSGSAMVEPSSSGRATRKMTTPTIAIRQTPPTTTPRISPALLPPPPGGGLVNGAE
ncbi:hypothetical protein [Stackebrandtia nassauensis]|nr:hypothetical protein [Stackebrandtia nassauensis]